VNPALNASVKMDWQTPESFLELVRKVGPIALDPCTVPENPTGASVWCTGKLRQMTNPPRTIDDGLDAPWAMWSVGGLVYVNPPYGRALPKWVDKCIAEAERGAEIILLVPARPDTKWFRRLFQSATGVLFWSGRIRFRGATAGAPFPSLVAHWGPNHARFREVFGPFGSLV
jgi:hypothetical protein